VSLSCWEASALIHGDLRFDNILVANASSGSTDLKLVDWELCQRGDPAWDVAWIIAGLVRIWLHTINLGDTGDNDFAVEQSNWSVYQAAVRSFWFGYCAAQGAPIVGEKLARFTVLALIQSVLESERYARHLTEPAILALQLCENIAVDPRRAADDFFALSAHDLEAS
jgi:aminoglycoside phosphotransferase (APT) family kinase protein